VDLVEEAIMTLALEDLEQLGKGTLEEAEEELMLKAVEVVVLQPLEQAHHLDHLQGVLV
jgi:hypothetical protein